MNIEVVHAYIIQCSCSDVWKPGNEARLLCMITSQATVMCVVSHPGVVSSPDHAVGSGDKTIPEHLFKTKLELILLVNNYIQLGLRKLCPE